MTDPYSELTNVPNDDPTYLAHTRLYDRIDNKNVKDLFQIPKGQPYEYINPAELFRMRKEQNAWNKIARSKSFVGEDFFPPIAAPLDSNLREVFADNLLTDQLEKLVEFIPHVNHDQLVQLALYLAFEAKLNDEHVW